MSIFASAKGASSAVQVGRIYNAAPTSTAPVWGKLVVSGNTVTCYYALGTATPTSWIQLGTPKTIGFLNNPVLVGLCITSKTASTVATATVDNFSISPKPTYRLQDGDIGSPALMGSANLINGVWSLTGAGTEIGGTADQFNFQPWLVWGDCTVICRVTSITSPNTSAKVGIMVRDGYNSGSDFAMFCTTPGSGSAFIERPEFNVNPDGSTVPTLVAPATTVTGTAVGVSPIGSSTPFFVLRP